MLWLYFMILMVALDIDLVSFSLLGCYGFALLMGESFGLLGFNNIMLIYFTIELHFGRAFFYLFLCYHMYFVVFGYLFIYFLTFVASFYSLSF